MRTDTLLIDGREVVVEWCVPPEKEKREEREEGEERKRWRRLMADVARVEGILAVMARAFGPIKQKG